MAEMDSSKSFSGIFRVYFAKPEVNPRAISIVVGILASALAVYCLYVLIFRPGNDQARYLYNVLSGAGLALGLVVACLALWCALGESKPELGSHISGHGVCGKSLERASIPLEKDEEDIFRNTHRLKRDSTAWRHLTAAKSEREFSVVDVVVRQDRVNPEQFSVADIVFTLDSGEKHNLAYAGELIGDDLCIALRGEVHWWGDRTSDMKIGLNDRLLEQLSLLGEVLEGNTGEAGPDRVITFAVPKTGKFKPMLLAGYAGLAAAATVDKYRERAVEKHIAKGDFPARLRELETKYNWKIQVVT